MTQTCIADLYVTRLQILLITEDSDGLDGLAEAPLPGSSGPPIAAGEDWIVLLSAASDHIAHVEVELHDRQPEAIHGYEEVFAPVTFTSSGHPLQVMSVESGFDDA